MKAVISSAIFCLALLSMTACTTTSGTDELLENDIEKIDVGMSKKKIESLLDSPSETYEKVNRNRVQQIINERFENETVNIANGLYDVWFYEAKKRTHHYYVFFFYNTYETNHCYFVFGQSDVAVYKRCQGVE